MTDQQDAFRSEMRIEARPEVVFTYFTDPAKMARWMGVDHKLDPVPGGVFLVDVNGRDTTMGEYLEVDAPRRVVFTWGWRDSTELPPGSSTVEVDLIPDGDATVVQLVHRGLPPGPMASHAEGWGHYLPRLAVAGAGGDAGPDEYVDQAAGRPPVKPADQP